MAKQTINLGTGELTGDGESIRSAFDKVNDNFDEVYARDLNTDAQTLSIDGNTISITGGNSVTIAPSVSLDGDLTGSVFADDSTLLVDGVSNKIVGNIDTASLRTSELTIALGILAGKTNQGLTAVAIGGAAGSTDQSTGALAVGYGAGYTGQGVDTVAVGKSAGRTNQGTNAIAIGEKAGYANQAANSIVINATGTEVYNFGASSLVITPVRDAVGTTIMMYDAGTGEVTHSSTIAGSLDGDITGSVFGDDSTVLVDGVNNKIVGTVETASLRTSETKIALGLGAGETNQGASAVAVGDEAGKTNQEARAVAIGDNAGATTQGTFAVAVGNRAGAVDQSAKSVAIGYFPGQTNQGGQAVAIGVSAGNLNQGEEAVAIGEFAGMQNQGESAVAIGASAGISSQAANSIVINATGTTLDNTTASSLVIKPIRNVAMTTILGYDAGTGEVFHNAAIPGYTNTADLKALVAASTDFADYQTRIAAL